MSKSKSLNVTVESARDAYVALCAVRGTDPIAEENAILSVGREFLPPCAIAVLDDRDAATVEYYEWLACEGAVGPGSDDLAQGDAE